MRRKHLFWISFTLWTTIVSPALQASEFSQDLSCAGEKPSFSIAESLQKALQNNPSRVAHWEAFQNTYIPFSPLSEHTWAEAQKKLLEFQEIAPLSFQATLDQVKAATATLLNGHIYLDTHEIVSDDHLKTFLQKMAQTYSNCRDQILAALQEPQNTMDHAPLNCTITNLNMFRDTLQSKVARIQKANAALNKRLMQQQFLAQIAHEEI